ncbi:hypothetical protein Q5752_005121 [Cryptotrichosporon argae]
MDSVPPDLAQAVLGLPITTRRDLAMALLWSLPRSDIVSFGTWAASMLQKDIIGSLPPELSFHIFAYLDAADLLRFRLVSHTWARLVDDQAVWAQQCAAHVPPIRPLPCTWADLTVRRQLLQLSPEASWDTDESLPAFASGLEEYHTSDAAGQITSRRAASGGRISGVGKVWERTNGLPFYAQSPSLSASSSPRPPEIQDQLIVSHLALPTSIPRPNYKHLYLTHDMLRRRMCARTRAHPPSLAASPGARRFPRPYVLNSSSSIRAGGLPAHAESIYSVCLIHHAMAVTREGPDELAAADVEGLWFDPFAHMDLTGPTPTVAPWPDKRVGLRGARQSQTLVFTGRDWLLSAARDSTLRLWQLACPQPRVVKVFFGGHESSVLCHYVVELPLHQGKGKGVGKSRMLAVSGGSDGLICVWDIEGGDGRPEYSWRAHDDSVLFMRGDDERIVSCSKDRTIKVFDAHTYQQLVVIGPNSSNSHRASANALHVTKEHIISASGDRTIRVWDIRTGALLANVDAEMRGISNIAFEPATRSFSLPLAPGTTASSPTVLGTIVAGSSDASIKVFYLVRTQDTSAHMSIAEFLVMEDEEMGGGASAGRDREAGERRRSQRESKKDDTIMIVPGHEHWAACACPSEVPRPDGVRCPRCLDRGHHELVRSLHIGEEVILSGSYDGTVKIWDRHDGQLLSSLSGHSTGRVLCVTGDRMRVVSSGIDSRIILWDYGAGVDTAFVEP